MAEAARKEYGSRDSGSRDGGSRDGAGAAAGGQRRVFFRRRKSCPLSGPKAPRIDYRDTKLLARFVSERGKILPSRITSVCSKKQRELARAIKRAREIALLPFVSQ